MNLLERLLAEQQQRWEEEEQQQQQQPADQRQQEGEGEEGRDRAPPTQPAAPAAAGPGAVEVLTVDRSQGRDKAALILSLVRSNPQRAAGQLLADWQRLNVAITRARVKLLIIGSASTLSSVPLLARLVGAARARGWVARLPPEATEAAGGAAAGGLGGGSGG